MPVKESAVRLPRPASSSHSDIVSSIKFLLFRISPKASRQRPLSLSPPLTTPPLPAGHQPNSRDIHYTRSLSPTKPPVQQSHPIHQKKSPHFSIHQFFISGTIDLGRSSARYRTILGPWCVTNQGHWRIWGTTIGTYPTMSTRYCNKMKQINHFYWRKTSLLFWGVVDGQIYDNTNVNMGLSLHIAVPTTFPTSSVGKQKH